MKRLMIDSKNGICEYLMSLDMVCGTKFVSRRAPRFEQGDGQARVTIP
jgi:hypothetical protein